MCRGCDETADGTGRRCNRPDGFTTAEADQRSRSRSLGGAIDALNNGDFQKAANQMMTAASAHNLLGGQGGGAATLTRTAPAQRTFSISPSLVDNMAAQIDRINQRRHAEGKPLLSMVSTPKFIPDPYGDPIARWQTTDVSIYGPDQEELNNMIFTGTDSTPEWRYPRDMLIGSTFASMRQNGMRSYISEKDDPNRSTTNEVLNAAVNKDNPDRGRLTPHEGDNIQTRGLLAWVQKLDDSTDYNRALKRVVSSDYVSYRDAKMLISAAGAHQQHVRERVQEQARIKANEKNAQQTTGTTQGKPAASKPATNNSASTATGAWLGSVGSKIAIPIKVIESRWVENKYNRWGNSVMIVGEDIRGNRVRFFYDNYSTPDEGIWLQAGGTVKEHRVVGRHKETLLTEADCWA